MEVQGYGENELVDMWLTVLLEERIGSLHTMVGNLEGKKFFARMDEEHCLLYGSEAELDKSKAKWIRPRKMFRADTRTVILDTGLMNFGKLVFGFDTLVDA